MDGACTWLWIMQENLQVHSHIFFFKVSYIPGLDRLPKAQPGPLQYSCTSAKKISHGSFLASAEPASEKLVTAFEQTHMDEPAAFFAHITLKWWDRRHSHSSCSMQIHWRWCLTELPKAGKENFVLYKVCHSHAAKCQTVQQYFLWGLNWHSWFFSSFFMAHSTLS